MANTEKNSCGNRCNRQGRTSYCERSAETSVSGTVSTVDPHDPPYLKEPGVELVEGNLESVASLEKVMEGANYMISAIGSKKPISSRENDKVDNRGNQNLVCAAKAKGSSR